MMNLKESGIYIFSRQTDDQEMSLVDNDEHDLLQPTIGQQPNIELEEIPDEINVVDIDESDELVTPNNVNNRAPEDVNITPPPLEYNDADETTEEIMKTPGALKNPLDSDIILLLWMESYF